MTAEWFSVDKEGLASILARRGVWFVVYELIQNAIDEADVTEVDVTLGSIDGRRGKARLIVTDDAPAGFDDLTHAFRLFAPSKKKGDAEKRGRFNLGEKLVLAVCEEARIVSTTGGYEFGAFGRRSVRSQRASGSSFDAVVRMSRADVEESARRVFSILPPAGVSLRFNNEEIPHRQPLKTFVASLPTEIADDEGQLRPTRRQTTVEVYEPVGDEEPMIYEMGIPVVESGDRYHVNIGQKVPLNMDRDNVTPGYLRAVRTAVLNNTHDLLTADDATATWVKEAISDERAEPAAVRQMVTNLYGADAVVYDPSDPEANKLAVAKGRTVIPPGAFDRATWSNVRKLDHFKPAGQVTPSNAMLITSPDGKPPIPEAEWTDGMRAMADYARRVARSILGFDVTVRFDRAVTGQRWAAAYGGRGLRFNLGQLGHRWFDSPDMLKVDALLIHEYAHEFAMDHLSSKFYDACCDLGAKMKRDAATIGGI